MPLLVRSSQTSDRPVIEVSCVVGAAVGDVLVDTVCNQDALRPIRFRKSEIGSISEGILDFSL